MIDRRMIEIKDLVQTLDVNDECRENAMNKGTTFLKGELERKVLDKFYDNSDSEFEMSNRIAHVIQDVLSCSSAIVDYKLSHHKYDDVQRHFLQFLTKNVTNKIFTEDDEIEVDIDYTNKRLLNDKDMIDSEKARHKINQFMLGQYQQELMALYKGYDLSKEEDIRRLYYKVYAEVNVGVAQFMADIQVLNQINRLIDLWNIEHPNDDGTEYNEIEIDDEEL